MEALMATGVLEKYNGKYPEAIVALFALLKGRLDTDGAAWFTTEDSNKISEVYKIESNGIGSLYKFVEAYLGVDLDRRGKKPDQVVMLMDLFKQTDGEWTDEVRDLFLEKYPEYKGGKGIGPLIGAARRRLGFQGPVKSPSTRVPQEPPPIPMASGLEDANILFQQYIKKLKKKETLEQELEQIKKELEVYAPIAKTMEAIQNVVRNVKEAEERIK